MTNKIYNYKNGSTTWKCHLIEKGSYLSGLKGFDRCANFDRVVRENGWDYLNKKLV